LPEVFVLGYFTLECIVLGRFATSWTGYALVIFILLDVLQSFLRDILANPLAELTTWAKNTKESKLSLFARAVPAKIAVRGTTRWLMLGLVNVFQIIVGFAVLFLYHGSQFSPPIENWITATYHSILTFTTLGYGDIRPICEVGRMVAGFELLFFVCFVVMRVPIAVSAICVRPSSPKSRGEPQRE
jgi:voltage-gated potassium channel